MSVTFVITESAKRKIEELCNEGWEFDLCYSSIMSDSMQWEADFTRSLPNGRWDNHEFGVSKNNPSKAIEQAYKNIRTGKKVKDGRE